MCIHFLPAEYNNHAAFASDMPKSWSSKWCSLTQKTYYLPLGLALPPTPSLSLSLFCTRSVLSCWARVPWPFALATLSIGRGSPTAHTTDYSTSLLLWPQNSEASVSLFGQQKLSTYFRSAISKWVLTVEILTPRNILHSLVPELPSSQNLRVWSADWIMVKHSLTSSTSQVALVV